MLDNREAADVAKKKKKEQSLRSFGLCEKHLGSALGMREQTELGLVCFWLIYRPFIP